MIACDLSQKHHFTKRGERQKLIVYKSSIIKLLFPILLEFGMRYLNVIEPASCMLHVFCSFMAVCLKAPKNPNLSLKTPR